MPTLHSYDYAYIHVVPRVERCEFINAGVILFCRTQRFLAAQIHLDEARLHALAPALSIALVRTHLDLIPRICAGAKQEARACAIGKNIISPIVMTTTAAANSQYADTKPNMPNPIM